MSLPGPTWIWALLVICLILFLGNALHVWQIHFSFGV